MYCEKCGKELNQNMQCECGKPNRTVHNIDASEYTLLPWINILAAVWWLILGEVFILKEVTAFVLLGMIKWFLSSGWLSLLICGGFLLLCLYLQMKCEDLGFENIVFKQMDRGKRGTIVKIGQICMNVFDLLILLQIVIGVIGFFRETGLLFNRGILLNTHIVKALQMSVLYSFLSMIFNMFSDNKNEKRP
ncbi:hypothetical protein [Blautia producta]|uniref:hypothetical protein n=1 Tax=Blautia producta TaxID=33035 RepID=UPI0031B64986